MSAEGLIVFDNWFRTKVRLIKGTLAPNSIHEWWDVVSAHLFSPVREGMVSAILDDPELVDRVYVAFAILFTLGAFLPFSWLLVNMPEFEKTSVIYLILYLASAIIISVEVYRPEYPFSIATFSPYLHLWQEFLVSIGAFLVLSAFSGVVTGSIAVSLQISPEQIPEFIPSFAIVAFSIPIVEWMAFHSVLMPSLFKWFGTVPSALLSLFLFPGFHWLVYASKPSALVLLAFFQLVVSVIYFLTRSVIPALVTHIMMNGSAVIHTFFPASIALFGISIPFSAIVIIIFVTFLGMGLGTWSPTKPW